MDHYGSILRRNKQNPDGFGVQGKDIQIQIYIHRYVDRKGMKGLLLMRKHFLIRKLISLSGRFTQVIEVCKYPRELFFPGSVQCIMFDGNQQEEQEGNGIDQAACQECSAQAGFPGQVTDQDHAGTDAQVEGGEKG